MILTDREIQIALQQKLVTIDPVPNSDAYSSTSVDLTLGDTFSVWKVTAGSPIRPGATGFKYTDFLAHQKTVTQNMFSLESQSFVLAWTAETVSIPIHSRLAARVEGKSSLARLGMGVHLTAPTIHCGFVGAVQLEIYNSGPNDIILDAGMRICQLIFEQTMGTPDKGYKGTFFGQSSTAIGSAST